MRCIDHQSSRVPSKWCELRGGGPADAHRRGMLREPLGRPCSGKRGPRADRERSDREIEVLLNFYICISVA